MTTDKKVVVIAEDDLDVAQALARIIRALGHTALTADNGVSALELLRTERVDVLLSDIDMPQMDGVTLASHAKNEQLAPVRILLTANARLDNAVSAINNGEIHRYIMKPWRHDELIQTLKESFARIDDLVRMNAASQAARRLQAACDALEAEYRGLTKITRINGAYDVDVAKAHETLAQLEGTTLAAVVNAVKPS